jgi:hypothetical protein
MEETCPYSNITTKDRHGVYGCRCVLVCGTLHYMCGQIEEQSADLWLASYPRNPLEMLFVSYMVTQHRVARMFVTKWLSR